MKKRKWKDGDQAVLMHRFGKNGHFGGIALMKIHEKENLYNPEYPKFSAETTENIYGNAHRDYRQELALTDAYTYKEALEAMFKYGVE